MSIGNNGGAKAQTLLAKFQGANHVITSSRMEMNDSCTLPMAPNYKLNVDDVVFRHIQGFRVEVWICDREGRAAMSK